MMFVRRSTTEACGLNTGDVRGLVFIERCRVVGRWPRYETSSSIIPS